MLTHLQVQLILTNLYWVCRLTSGPGSFTLSALQLASAAHGEGPTVETGFAGAGAAGIRDIHRNTIQMEGWMDWWPGRGAWVIPSLSLFLNNLFFLIYRSGLSVTMRPWFLLIRKPILSYLRWTKIWVLRFCFLIWFTCVSHQWFN